MAEFCKQCSIEIFGEDFKDFTSSWRKELPKDYGYLVICEGCGPTKIDVNGKCIYVRCPKHGIVTKPVYTMVKI